MRPFHKRRQTDEEIGADRVHGSENGLQLLGRFDVFDDQPDGEGGQTIDRIGRHVGGLSRCGRGHGMIHAHIRFLRVPRSDGRRQTKVVGHFGIDETVLDKVFVGLPRLVTYPSTKRPTKYEHPFRKRPV